MQVILREELSNLGTTGDVVKVKPGYARNYLLPRGLAVEASVRNLQELEHQKRVIADKRLREQKSAAAVADKIRSVKLVFQVRAGDDGRLFGSVTNQDIHRQLEERGSRSSDAGSCWKIRSRVWVRTMSSFTWDPIRRRR